MVSLCSIRTYNIELIHPPPSCGDYPFLLFAKNLMVRRETAEDGILPSMILLKLQILVRILSSRRLSQMRSLPLRGRSVCRCWRLVDYTFLHFTSRGVAGGRGIVTGH